MIKLKMFVLFLALIALGSNSFGMQEQDQGAGQNPPNNPQVPRINLPEEPEEEEDEQVTPRHDSNPPAPVDAGDDGDTPSSTRFSYLTKGRIAVLVGLGSGALYLFYKYFVDRNKQIQDEEPEEIQMLEN